MNSLWGRIVSVGYHFSVETYFRKMSASARRSGSRKLVGEIYRKKPTAEKGTNKKKKKKKIPNRACVFPLRKIQRVNADAVSIEKKKLVGKITTEAFSLEDVALGKSDGERGKKERNFRGPV